MYILSYAAAADLNDIVDNKLYDRENGGPDAATQIFNLMDQFLTKVADKPDIKTKRPLLYATAKPTKHLVAFDLETREIARIVHGSSRLSLAFMHE